MELINEMEQNRSRRRADKEKANSVTCEHCNLKSNLARSQKRLKAGKDVKPLIKSNQKLKKADNVNTTV